jgi:hypothetical protein
MAYFLCTLIHGPRWDDTRAIRDQDGWSAHAEFMDSLVADGMIIVGGPIGDGRYTAHLMWADGEDQIRRRLADDPGATDDHLVVGMCEPWALWLDGRA